MRFTAEQIATMRDELAATERFQPWLFPAGGAVIAFFVLAFNVFGNWPTAEGVTILAMLACVILTFIVIKHDRPETARLKAILTQYADAERRWNLVLERSAPQADLDCPLRLKPNERVFYAEPGARLEERLTHQDIATHTRTPNGIGAAIVGDLVAGPAGGIVASNIARRETTGTATNVYDLVAVDQGTVIATSLRFVFIGSRNTVEVPNDSLLQEFWPSDDDILEVHYPQRAPGEAYTVDGDLFVAAFARRSDLDYDMPLPPEPLAEDYGSQLPGSYHALPAPPSS